MVNSFKKDWLYDPLDIAISLLQYQSITPAAKEVFAIMRDWLDKENFIHQRFDFSDKDTATVTNLYSYCNHQNTKDTKNLAFAGHLDVVPVGSIKQWSYDPFAATCHDGLLYGRGTADMKGGIAAWMAAALEYVHHHQHTKNCLSFIITGDEEGPAINGTKKLLHAIAEQGITIDACITGEPTNPDHIGDEIKVGRRGSANFNLTVVGKQGHIAYPHLADNPIHKMVTACHHLTSWVIDDGNEFFAPSHLEISSIDVGNTTRNIIPQQATALINIRFNDIQTAESLYEKMTNILDNAIDHDAYHLTYHCNSESFITHDENLINLLSQSCYKITGFQPTLSTKGGTSDSRFIKNYCPVLDFGLVGKTMHQVDEHIAIDDLYILTAIYYDFMTEFFK